MSRFLIRDTVLERRVRELLAACGEWRVPAPLVVWNARMTTSAGFANYRQGAIHLNPALRRIGEEEIDRTLRHELAHFLARHRHGPVAAHGPEWRQACADLGIPQETRCHTLPLGRRRQAARKFFYQCPHCGLLIARVRPFRRPSACLACCRRYNGGRYAERFRLVALALSATLPVPTPPCP